MAINLKNTLHGAPYTTGASRSTCAEDNGGLEDAMIDNRLLRALGLV